MLFTHLWSIAHTFMFTPYHQTSIANKGGQLTPITKHEIDNFDLVFKKNQTHCFHVAFECWPNHEHSVISSLAFIIGAFDCMPLFGDGRVYGLMNTIIIIFQKF
jgi:hypothetical protein